MSAIFWSKGTSNSFWDSRFGAVIFTRLLSNYYLLTMIAVLLIADMYSAQGESVGGDNNNAVSTVSNKLGRDCIEWFQRIVSCSIEPGKYDAGFVSCVKSGAYWQLAPHGLIRKCFVDFGNEVGEALAQGFNRTLQLYAAKVFGINECWGSDLSACPVSFSPSEENQLRLS